AVVERTRAQRVAAERLAAAGGVPTFVLMAEVDMTGCAELRARIAEVPGAAVPTVTDLVVTAAGRALREHPAVNAEWRDGEVVAHERVHVGMAVDTPDGLLVPTVTDAGTRSLSAVGAATRDLAARARAGRCTPAELGGASFTVSNLGAFGVRAFTAVVNPPQAAILAVGAARDTAVVREGAVVVRSVMTVALTCDHRVLDGATAARFLTRLTALLDQPLALVLDPQEEVP
ncbi:2-oxo acid dehydrogenase subunit E2, partial [Pseudonocardia lacus]|uniref:2-oxo acid dehydrogenase subunit E2 n=1 Tax=Pseudonocardia lacus TaxID=2835865 RepID=UPI001BDCBF43